MLRAVSHYITISVQVSTGENRIIGSFHLCCLIELNRNIIWQQLQELCPGHKSERFMCIDHCVHRHYTNTATNYYLIMVAAHSLKFTCRRNLIAIASLVSFNVFSQNVFLTIPASHGCTFTARMNMFLDK